jgi:hypothetical protein
MTHDDNVTDVLELDEPKRHRRLIFSLKALFVVVTVCAIMAKFFAHFGVGGVIVLFLLWIPCTLFPSVFCFPLLIWGSRRANWQRYELLAFVIPYLIWAVCIPTVSIDRGTWHPAEYFLISMTISLAMLVRIAVGYRKNQWLYSGAMIVGICIVAVSLPPHLDWIRVD